MDDINDIDTMAQKIVEKKNLANFSTTTTTKKKW